MFRSSGEKKDDLTVLFEIKNLIESRSVKTALRDVRDPDEKLTQIHGRMDDLNGKLDELRDIVTGLKSAKDGTKKLRMKKEIITTLDRQKRLNPSELGKFMGLSRVRANEYLRELEEEKIVKGIVINRKKFYMLEDDIAKKAF
jgi:hypothetical protein